MTEQQEQQHFLDYWAVIRERKEIILLVFLVVVAAGTTFTLMQPKTYMASTRIAVSHETPVVGVTDNTLRGSPSRQYDPFFLRTQYEILQSRQILHEVIRQLDLQEHFGRAYHPEGRPLTLQNAYELLKGSMRVQQYRDTNLIEVRVMRDKPEETAPEDTARIANSIVEVFRDTRMGITRTETMRGLNALRAALEAQEKRVVEAETNLDRIRRELDISTIGGIESGRISPLDKSELAQLEMKRIESRARLHDTRTRIEQLNKLEGRELMYAAAHIVGDPDLSKVRERLLEAEAHLSQLRESYGERHPDVLRLNALVTDLEEKIADILGGIKIGLQTRYEIATADLNSIENELRKARETDIADQSERYLPYINAERELRRRRQIRDSLEMRLIQEELEIDLPRNPVEIIDLAEAPNPNNPVKPNVTVNILLSILLGISLGTGLAFFTDYLDTSIKSVEELERLVGVPVLGMIPHKMYPLMAKGRIESHDAEAYRVLRANIQFSKKFADGRTLCITSGGAGEGKSLTLFNLACTCASMGDRVLLVDSDLRRPTQHKLFGMSNSSGLTDVLLEKMTPDQAIKKTAHANLDFMPSGRFSHLSYGLLDSARMRDLLQRLKERYRYVFLDTPPVLSVSDASVLASESCGVLLVVQHNHYRKDIAIRARMMLENIGANVIGAALNNVSKSQDYYYQYQYSADPHEDQASVDHRKNNAG